jgi:NitT/TauT family transport system permease protein
MVRLRTLILEEILPPLILFVLVLVVWHMAVVWTGVKPFLLPSPLKVMQTIWENSGKLAVGIRLTGAAALAGFGLSVLLGTLTGFVFSQSRLIRNSGYPYAIFLQTVPIIAIAPLIIFWCGRGFVGVVVVAFIISLFPMIANATAGLTSVDPDLLDLFRLNNASRWQVLWKLRLPNSVPAICTGAKTASGLAVVGAIVGEFYTGAGTNAYGLGYLIQFATGRLKVDELFACIFASTLLGVVIFGSVNLISDRILSRWYVPVVEYRG